MTASKPKGPEPWYERAWNARFALMPFYVGALVLIAGLYCSAPWEYLTGPDSPVVTFLVRYGPPAVAALGAQMIALARTRSTPTLVFLAFMLLSGLAYAVALPIVVGRSFAHDPRSGVLSLVLMPVVLVVLCIAFGVPWWASKVNRSQAKVESEQRSWGDIAGQFGLGDTKRQNHVETGGGGVTGQLVWPKGKYTVKEVMDRREKLEGAMDLPYGTLRLMRHGKATDRIDYAAFRDDPQTEAQEWPGVPVDPATGEAIGELSCTDPTPIGRNDQGQEITLPTWKAGFGGFNILMGGDQGSGKSGGLNLHIGHLACCSDAAQVFADFKGGVELKPWAGTGLGLLTEQEQVMGFILALEAFEKARQELLADDSFMPGRLWTPRGMPQNPGDPEQAPFVKFWIDEIAEITSNSAGRTSRDQRRVMEVLTSFVRNDRALGAAIGGATQQFGLNALADSAFRNRFNQRVCYRVGQPEEESKILGLPTTVGAAQIDPDRPGTAFIVQQGAPMTNPVRYYYFSDELVDQIAAIREFGGCELESHTDDAMAEASDWWREQRDARRERMRAQGLYGEDAEVIVPVAPESVRPWIAVTGPAEQAADVAAGREVVADVPVADVFAAHDARKAAAAAAAGEDVEADAQPGRPKLSPSAAMDAAMDEVRSAGPDGARAVDIFTAANRGSSWFHTSFRGRFVEADGGDGTVVQTGSGRYALAPVPATNGS